MGSLLVNKKSLRNSNSNIKTYMHNQFYLYLCMIIAVFLEAVSSILVVVLVCAVGYVAALYRKVTDDFFSDLTKFLVYVLLPCFLFLRVMNAVSASTVLSWWPVMLFGVLQVLIAYIIGKLLFIPLRSMDPSLSSLLIACITWQNSGNLPFVLLSAAVKNTTLDIFEWDGSDVDPTDRAIAYISLYTATWTVFAWTFGYNQTDPERHKRSSTAVIPVVQPGKPCEDVEKGGDKNDSQTNSQILKSGKNGCEATELSVWDRLKRIFAPPTVGSLLGIIVGVISVVKKNVFLHPPVLVSGAVEALNLLGLMMLGAAMIVLGGTLGQYIYSKKEKGKTGAEKEVSSTVIALVVCARLIIVPTISMWITLVAWNWDLMFTKDMKDPVLLFVLLCEPAQPGAMALNLLGKIHNHPHENIISMVLFWQYSIAAFTLTAFVSIFMMLLPTWA